LVVVTHKYKKGLLPCMYAYKARPYVQIKVHTVTT
jgi:hypothetical protein